MAYANFMEEFSSILRRQAYSERKGIMQPAYPRNDVVAHVAEIPAWCLCRRDRSCILTFYGSSAIDRWRGKVELELPQGL